MYGIDSSYLVELFRLMENQTAKENADKEYVGYDGGVPREAEVNYAQPMTLKAGRPKFNLTEQAFSEIVLGDRTKLEAMMTLVQLKDEDIHSLKADIDDIRKYALKLKDNLSNLGDALERILKDNNKVKAAFMIYLNESLKSPTPANIISHSPESSVFLRLLNSHFKTNELFAEYCKKYSLESDPTS